MGAVVWITGLAASGKTTFMRTLADELNANGLRPIQLDGDELRRVFRQENRSYDYDGRLLLGKQYSDLCQMLALQGHLVLIATIALFHEIHAKNRRDLPNYLEVLMDTTLEEAQKRDYKGVYAERLDKTEAEIVGVTWNAQLPVNPDFRVSLSRADFNSTAKCIASRVLAIHGERASKQQTS